MWLFRLEKQLGLSGKWVAHDIYFLLVPNIWNILHLLHLCERKRYLLIFNRIHLITPIIMMISQYLITSLYLWFRKIGNWNDYKHRSIHMYCLYVSSSYTPNILVDSNDTGMFKIPTKISLYQEWVMFYFNAYLVLFLHWSHYCTWNRYEPTHQIPY